MSTREGARYVLQGDADAFLDFSSSRLNNARGEQVERSVYILLPVLVKDAPGAALWHTVDGGQIIEFWNLERVGHGGMKILFGYCSDTRSSNFDIEFERVV